MRSFFKEFKEFIKKGNVLDLAVAVIIGGAFSAIVTALTNKVIMPLVSWVLAMCGGKEGFEGAITILSRVEDAEGNLDLTQSIYIDWGAFISAILNFLIIALTVFIIVKTFNASKRRMNEVHSKVKSSNAKELKAEKKMIKAKAKEEGRPFDEVWAEYQEQKQKEAEALEEENKRKEEEERKNNPTQEELLKDIRELLAMQVGANASKKTSSDDEGGIFFE